MIKGNGVNCLGKIFFSMILMGAMLMAPIITFAQDLPCGGDSDDPFDQATCPLDTWVFILAVIAGLFAVIHLCKNRPCQISK